MTDKNKKCMTLIDYLLQEKEILESASGSYDYEELCCIISFIENEICLLKLEIFKDQYFAYRDRIFDGLGGCNE